jgi:hypothetical protein
VGVRAEGGLEGWSGGLRTGEVVVGRREVPAHAAHNGKAQPRFPNPVLWRFKLRKRTRRARQSCTSPGRSTCTQQRVESVSHWSRVLQFDAKGAPDRRELVGEVRAAGVGGVEAAAHGNGSA